MSFSNVKCTTGVKGEIFKVEGDVIAKIMFDEKVIVGFAVSNSKVKKYELAEVSDEKFLKDASVAFLVKSQAAAKECVDVLEDLIAVEYKLEKKAKQKVVDYVSKLQA